MLSGGHKYAFECICAFVIKIKSTLRIIIENEFSLMLISLGNGVEDYEIYTGCEYNKSRKIKKCLKTTVPRNNFFKKSKKGEESEREKKEEGQGHRNKTEKQNIPSLCSTLSIQWNLLHVAHNRIP